MVFPDFDTFQSKNHNVLKFSLYCHRKDDWVFQCLKQQFTNNYFMVRLFQYSSSPLTTENTEFHRTSYEIFSFQCVQWFLWFKLKAFIATNRAILSIPVSNTG